MEQTRDNMVQILAQLQQIQVLAIKKSIHTFEVNTRVYQLEDEGDGDEGLIREYGDTEERFIDVTVFKTGDDSDEDYLSVTFYQDDKAIDVLRKVNQIKNFIDYV